MGWLGWSEAEALAADVNSIELALAAKADLLKTIYGSGEKGKPEQGKGKGKQKVTAGRFKAWAARMNGSRKNG